MKSTDRIREASSSFIQTLLDLEYSPADIVDGMDEALELFELANELQQ